MKALLSLTLFCYAGVLAGCNYRFYIQKKAEWAPPEVAAQVKFPGSTVGNLSLDGPTLKAIDVAMNEFLPPGAKVKSHDERLAQRLSKRETYDVSVLRADSLFFVTLSAELPRCGLDLDVMVMDAGAVYAVDSQGRILGKR
ncbi:hypothetical protein [Archangium sp.]|uniref:hypothetical protein n=1 Tax=Archangium sp. TaxID=1872627 RepID=UPI002D2F19E5|nr:hypothetical protein [Archangium sp.]HYO53470.1 hypothetical protein [Archangium sp.]